MCTVLSFIALVSPFGQSKADGMKTGINAGIFYLEWRLIVCYSGRAGVCDLPEGSGQLSDGCESNASLRRLLQHPKSSSGSFWVKTLVHIAQKSCLRCFVRRFSLPSYMGIKEYRIYKASWGCSCRTSSWGHDWARWGSDSDTIDFRDTSSSITAEIGLIIILKRLLVPKQGTLRLHNAALGRVMQLRQSV